MASRGLYDEDDLYDGDNYEEDEQELSPEDKVAMDHGTEQVKLSLGQNAGKVTVKQIQDALWHYYYDVDKSVAYLSKTFIAPPPKTTPKKQPPSKLNEFSFAPYLGLFVKCTGTKHPAGHTGLSRAPLVLPTTSTSMFLQAEFRDMPWLNTPSNRHGVLIAPPQLPGGLLGGADAAPKMSKLQALAAARKRKALEKKEHGRTSPTESGMRGLSLAEDSQQEEVGIEPLSAKRQRSSDASLSPSHSSLGIDMSSFKDLQNRSSHRHEEEKVSTESSISAPLLSSGGHDPIASHSLMSSPSAFAKVLCNPPAGIRQRSLQEVYPYPYTLSPLFNPAAFSGPSPDDVVLAAQAKAGKKAVAAPKSFPSAAARTQKNDETSNELGLAKSMSDLKVGEKVPPKSKGLNVVAEYEASDSKKSISFVVVGHVDAGKSTLMGRLLLELKYVQERTVDKYRRQAEKTGKQSFALAWVMDQRTEERERGVTIDIATSHFETSRTKFTILDAPGHRDFVPNMIAGASQADFAILVIDANTGAYEKGLKGQTKEHVLLLRSLGVQRLLVAVNKLDMVEWSRDRFDEISQQVLGFLTGLGFQQKLVSFIPISGLNGDNIAGKSEDAAAAWYNGPTLIEALEDSETSSTRSLTKPFRMSISEVFRSQSQGATTLAGRIESGHIQIGDAVLVQPSGETTYVKSIMSDLESRDWAVAGQSVSIALTDIDPMHVRVGDVICSVSEPIGVGDTFTMKAMAFEHLMPMPVDLHRGRLHAAGQIHSMVASLDKASGDITKRKPRVVQPGEVARVVIKLSSKIPLERGQRIVLRRDGETVAAGLLE